MTETEVHSQICEYLHLQYPDIIFFTDLSGVKLPIGLAKKIKKLKSGRGIPDLIILEPRKGFHALCIEIKKEGESPFTKKGQLKKDSTGRNMNQYLTLNALKKRGYKAEYGIGFYETKRIIDEYLK